MHTIVIENHFQAVLKYHRGYTASHLILDDTPNERTSDGSFKNITMHFKDYRHVEWRQMCTFLMMF